MRRLAIAVMVASLLTLAACSSSGDAATTESSAGASEGATATSASGESAASPMDETTSGEGSTTGAFNPTNSPIDPPSTCTSEPRTATGTVVTTTYAERAAEVGYAGDDYADDTGLLTLLVLDEPITVTAYKGGSDYTGEASVICLPNDEMFRQFSGKQITISVSSWGEWPADVSGMLYDLVVDFDADGLGLVE